MPYATFMLLTATPAWLALPESTRREIVTGDVQPLLAQHRACVHATYYDTEAYSARPSDLLMLEYDEPHAHAPLIDSLRNSPLLAHGYFQVDQIVVGEKAAWLQPLPDSGGNPGAHTARDHETGHTSQPRRL